MAKLDTTKLDLIKLTDAELDELRVAVLTAQERRAAVSSIPQQVQALAQQYRAAGGDLEQLTLEAPAPVEVPDVAPADGE